MIIKHIENPFDKSTHKTVEVEWEDINLAEFFTKNIAGCTQAYHPVVNSKIVDWQYKPLDADEVAFVKKIEDTGSIVSGVIGAVLLIASIWCPALAPVAYGFLAGALVGGVNHYLFQEEPPSVGSLGFENTQTYSWSGAMTTSGEGAVLPVVLGKHRVGGHIIEAFLDQSRSDPDVQNLKVVLALSEGEVLHIDYSTLKINEQPYSNFPGLYVALQTGTNGQPPLSQFSQIRRYYGMSSNVLIEKGDPYVYTTIDPIDAAYVHITMPALYKIDDKGNMQENRVVVWVEYSADKINWTMAHDATGRITAKSRAPLNRIFAFNVQVRQTYYIRISRYTDNFETSKEVGDIYLKGITEIEDGNLSYPNTALLGLSIPPSAQLSGPVPDFSIVISGVKIPDVRTGAVTAEGIRNPANQLHAILTNKRWGLGHQFNMNGDTLASLQAFADWCDETITFRCFVANQTYETYTQITHARYRTDLVLDRSYKAIDVINKICSLCRATPFWVGDKLKIVVDRLESESSYSQTFTMGNIIEGSFEEIYASPADIPTQILVTYADEENDYKTTNIIAIDKSRLNDPVLEISLNLVGLSDKARVKREAVYALKKAKGVTKTIKFKASIDALWTEPGDLFRFQHDIPQYGYGGRVLDVAGVSIYLGRTVPLVGGTNAIRVMRANGTTFYYTFEAAGSGTTDVVNLSYSGHDIGKGDVWTFGPVGYDSKLFRAVSITRASETEFEIIGEEYNSSVFIDDPDIDVRELHDSLLGLTVTYDLDESGTPTNPSTVPGSGNSYEYPPYVNPVLLSEELQFIGDAFASCIVVNFEEVTLSPNSNARVAEYKVIYSTNSGETWQEAGVCTSGYFRIMDVTVGQLYHVLVAPVTTAGLTNSPEVMDWALDFSIVPQGDQAPPMAPTELEVSGDVFINTLNWENPTDKDLKFIEIWCSAGNSDFTGAVKVGQVGKTETWTHSGLHQNTVYYYWIRAEDAAGNVSSFCPLDTEPGVAGQPINDPAKVLELLNESITEGQLNAELSEKITNSVRTTSDMELLRNQWTVKIQEDNTVVGAGLLLYEDWDADRSYAIGEYVWGPDEELYKCIVAHTGQQPPNQAYWDWIRYGAKSEFIVRANKFAIVSPDGTGNIKTPFTVGKIGGVETVGIDGNLVLDGSVTFGHLAGDVQNLFTRTGGNEQVPLSSYMGLYMKLDDGYEANQIIDDSGKGNHGNPMGLCTPDAWGEGRVGKAIVCNGTDTRYVQVPNHYRLTPSNSMGYGCWAYKDDWSTLPATTQSIIGKYFMGGYKLEITANNHLAAVVVSASGERGVSTDITGLAAGWHHFWVNYTARILSLYIDGELVERTDFEVNSSITYVHDNSLLIGARVSTGDHPTPGIENYFDGRIDEVRIYYTYLFDSEVSVLFNNPECDPGPINLAVDWTKIASKPNFGGLAYEDMVEVAKLGTTVIQGGYLKTELINANALFIGDFKGGSTASGAQNLLTNGDFEMDALYSKSTVGWDVSSYESSMFVYRNSSVYPPWNKDGNFYYCSVATSGGYGRLQSSGYIPVDPNKPFTLSCWLRRWNGTGNTYLGIIYYDSSQAAIVWRSGEVVSGYNPSASWSQVSATVYPYGTSGVAKTMPNGTRFVKVVLTLQDNLIGGVVASRLCLNEGEVIAPWSQADAATNTTSIIGNAINTGIIRSNNFDSNNGMAIDLDNARIIVNEADGLEITNGANILMHGDNSNPSQIKFSTTGGQGYTIIEQQNTYGNFFIYPQLTGNGYLYFGTSSKGIWNQIQLRSNGLNLMWTVHPNSSSLYAQISTNYYRAQLYVVNSSTVTSLSVLNGGSIEAKCSRLAPQSGVTANLGGSGYRWNYIYSSHSLVVGDLYWMDERRGKNGKIIEVDDVEVIKSIKPGSKVDSKTGLRLINDSTLPKWLVHRHSEDGEDKDDKGERIRSWKAGDVAYSHDGKPYLSLTTLHSLEMGAIRQLDERLRKLENLISQY